MECPRIRTHIPCEFVSALSLWRPSLLLKQTPDVERLALTNAASEND